MLGEGAAVTHVTPLQNRQASPRRNLGEADGFQNRQRRCVQPATDSSRHIRSGYPCIGRGENIYLQIQTIL